MKVLGYVNRFNRGINMVQEILEENKNGDAIFDFKDISTFKVTVMSADPKPEGDTEKDTGRSRNDIENGADGIENDNNGIDGAEKTIGVGEVSEKCRRKMSEKNYLKDKRKY
jgi:ATP-dependent DNA helicase RecG